MTTNPYAKDTKVPAEKTRMEIEQTLKRYGADSFISGENPEKFIVYFGMNGRHIRFDLPKATVVDFETTASGWARNPDQVTAAVEKERRRRWRALLLVIKAKLEAVESGITQFEDEFMANIVLPDGQTVSHFMRPQIELAYERGDMPKMLQFLGD